MLILLLVTLASLKSVVSVHENETLYLLGLAPYPDGDYVSNAQTQISSVLQGGWTQSS